MTAAPKRLHAGGVSRFRRSGNFHISRRDQAIIRSQEAIRGGLVDQKIRPEAGNSLPLSSIGIIPSAKRVLTAAVEDYEAWPALGVPDILIWRCSRPDGILGIFLFLPRDDKW